MSTLCGPNIPANFTQSFPGAIQAIHGACTLTLRLIAMSASDPIEKEVTMQSRIQSLLLASLLASAGFAAFAQPMGSDANQSPMMGAGGGMQHGAAMGKNSGRDPARMEAMMAKRHDALKAKLKLTPEQEGAWTTFTAAMKPPAQSGQKYPDRAEMDKLTTPERIDKMRALRTERMAAMNSAMDKREDAIKAFYATLTADQKKVFDTEHARMGGRKGEHRGPGSARSGDKPR